MQLKDITKAQRVVENSQALINGYEQDNAKQRATIATNEQVLVHDTVLLEQWKSKVLDAERHKGLLEEDLKAVESVFVRQDRARRVTPSFGPAYVALGRSGAFVHVTDLLCRQRWEHCTHRPCLLHFRALHAGQATVRRRAYPATASLAWLHAPHKRDHGIHFISSSIGPSH